jgi:hypothetical protein
VTEPPDVVETRTACDTVAAGTTEEVTIPALSA